MLYAWRHGGKAIDHFTLYLQAVAQYERIEGVTSLIAQDASGRFGILSGHERMVTTLVPGLAQFRIADYPWHYLALPDSVLYFVNNELFINTRRYLKGYNYEDLSTALESQLLVEERELAQIKRSLNRMEEEMFKRLWQMGRGLP